MNGGGDKSRGTKRDRTAIGGDGDDDEDVDDPFAGIDEDENVFQNLNGKRKPETEEERKRRIDAAVGNGEDNANPSNNEEGADAVNLDEEEQELSQEDDDYEDDEDGGDYDAEQYFDNGADNDMDDDGVGESAMDF